MHPDSIELTLLLFLLIYNFLFKLYTKFQKFNHFGREKCKDKFQVENTKGINTKFYQKRLTSAIIESLEQKSYTFWNF